MHTAMKVGVLTFLVAALFCVAALDPVSTAQGQFPSCDDKCRERTQFWSGSGQRPCQYEKPNCRMCVKGGQCKTVNTDLRTDWDCVWVDNQQYLWCYNSLPTPLVCQPALSGDAEASFNSADYTVVSEGPVQGWGCNFKPAYGGG
jgi:hypothetical protein